MVNGIGFSNNIYPQRDLENLARYATGVPLTNDANKLTIGDMASYPLTISAYEGFGWAVKNKGKYKEAFKSITNNAKEANQIFKTGGYKAVLNTANAKDVLSFIPQQEILSKLSSTTQELYSKTKKYAELAKANPLNSTAAKDASSFLAKAKAAAYSEATANPKGFGKVKKALGITKINQGMNNLAAKSPTFSKCLDAYKNEAGTFMLVMEGGVEAFTNVVPTFKQLGFKKGLKQTGKSIVKTVLSVAGWVAGSAVGTKLGQVVGAALGNNKLGAVIGTAANTIGSYVTGTVGQHLTNKLADKVLGKSELEKAREEQAVALATEAQNNPEIFEALVQQAAQRLAVEGEETPDAMAMNDSLQKLVDAKKANPQTTTSSMMTREEMADYAQKLNNDGVLVQNNAQSQNRPQPQVTSPINSNEAESAKFVALFDKADRAIANATKFIS